MDYLQYENYLAHYGVVGMKWGVRRYQNKDGSLTVAGKKRLYKDTKRAYKQDRYGYEHYGTLGRNKLVKGIHESLRDKRAAYEKADYLSKQFQSDDNLVLKYMKKAHAEDAKRLGYDPDNRQVIRDMADMYQDSTMDAYVGGKAFRLYLKDMGVDPQTYMTNAHEAYDNYMDECRKVVKNMLGDIGDMTVTNVNGTYKYSTAITGAVINKAQKEWEHNLLYAQGYEA